MCHCKPIIGKIVVAATILIALVLAILVSVWHQQGLTYIIFISRFFDVMLPILAVGALLKYLMSCPCCCCGKECQCRSEGERK